MAGWAPWRDCTPVVSSPGLWAPARSLLPRRAALMSGCDRPGRALFVVGAMLLCAATALLKPAQPNIVVRWPSADRDIAPWWEGPCQWAVGLWWLWLFSLVDVLDTAISGPCLLLAEDLPARWAFGCCG